MANHLAIFTAEWVGYRDTPLYMGWPSLTSHTFPSSTGCIASPAHGERVWNTCHQGLVLTTATWSVTLISKYSTNGNGMHALTLQRANIILDNAHHIHHCRKFWLVRTRFWFWNGTSRCSWPCQWCNTSGAAWKGVAGEIRAEITVTIEITMTIDGTN
jgi:hypothetical protein